LKLFDCCEASSVYIVAPHAGAGIEITISAKTYAELEVAPHAGAGIETLVIGFVAISIVVAPHAGAGIET